MKRVLMRIGNNALCSQMPKKSATSYELSNPFCASFPLKYSCVRVEHQRVPNRNATSWLRAGGNSKI